MLTSACANSHADYLACVAVQRQPHPFLAPLLADIRPQYITFQHQDPFLLRDGHGAANGRICGVDVSVYYALFSTRYGRWRVDIDQIEVYGASQIVASQQKSARAHDMIDAAASAPIGAVVDRQDPERLLDDMIVQRGADRRCVGNAGEIVRPIADAKASRPEWVAVQY